MFEIFDFQTTGQSLQPLEKGIFLRFIRAILKNIFSAVVYRASPANCF